MRSRGRRRTERGLVGRLCLRDDAHWLAEILLDLETDEIARLQVAEGLRVALAADCSCGAGDGSPSFSGTMPRCRDERPDR